MHTVEFVLDAQKTPISPSMRNKALTTGGGDGSTEDGFEASRIESKSVAGGVYRNSPGEFEGVKCTYDATFTSPVWKEPPPNTVAPQQLLASRERRPFSS